MDTNDERLQAYLDGELEPQAKVALEADLARDPGLAAQLDQLRALYARLDSLEDEPLTRDLRPGVLAALAKSTNERAWPAWLLPAEGALALALLALAARSLRSLPLIGLDVGSSLSSRYTNLLFVIQLFLDDSTRALSGLGPPDFSGLLPGPVLDLPAASLLGLAAGLILLGLLGNRLLLRTFSN